MNKQPIEKRRLDDTGEILEVHSIFYTIQGEGPFCGTPAVFVRLAGCNLQCPGCDTDYTSSRLHLTVEQILDAISINLKTKLVVITGGEPFRQNLSRLLRTLVNAGHYVQIETNGTVNPSKFDYNVMTQFREGVYIVCSPKTGKLAPSIAEKACALKYVVNHNDMDDDGLPIRALQHSANPRVARPPKNFRGLVYIQPMDEQNEEVNQRNLQAAVASSLEFGYILQLQVHKLIGVP